MIVKMYSEDEDGDWDDVDSEEEERREAEEELYHQIYHQYQDNDHLKDGLTIKENDSSQIDLDISKSGRVSEKKIICGTSIDYMNLWLKGGMCWKNEALSSHISRIEDKVESTSVSDADIIILDSDSSKEGSIDDLAVKKSIKTYGKVRPTTARPTEVSSSSTTLKEKNRKTREVLNGYSLGNSCQGNSPAAKELEGFRGSEDDDVNEFIDLPKATDCRKKKTNTFKYENRSRILGAVSPKVIEQKQTKHQERPPKVHENGENQWSSLTSKRYFIPEKLEDNLAKCYNCFMLGHTSQECSEPQAVPTCPLCGVKGHVSYLCPKQLCFNCDVAGHQSKKCPFVYQSPHYQCTRCTMYGHTEEKCPDNWRQYHLTTDDGELVTSKKPVLKPERMFCYNCGMKGHLGHMCEGPRMTVRKGEMVTLPTMPLVCLYKRQKTTRKEDKKNAVIRGWIGKLQSNVNHYKKQAMEKMKGKMGKHIMFTEDDADQTNTVSHCKRQRRKKGNGKIGRRVMFDDDVVAKREGDRMTQISFETNCGNKNQHKSKRRKRKKSLQNDSTVFEDELFTMTLRERINNNKRRKIDLDAEQEPLQITVENRYLPDTVKPIQKHHGVKRKGKCKKKGDKTGSGVLKHQVKN